MEFPSHGVYRDVVTNQRLVFTDPYTEAWLPSEKPFMTATPSIEDLDGKPKYTARVSTCLNCPLITEQLHQQGLIRKPGTNLRACRNSPKTAR